MKFIEERNVIEMGFVIMNLYLCEIVSVDNWDFKWYG